MGKTAKRASQGGSALTVIAIRDCGLRVVDVDGVCVPGVRVVHECVHARDANRCDCE